MKPRLLDLFCGAGGATAGYQRAGFTVIGVDHAAQPRYCGDEFICADVFDFLSWRTHEFDLIHASPPCQAYSKTQRLGRGLHPDLVGTIRRVLVEINKPWVIENVVGAPLLNPALLCGTMFGLRVYRHRLFETSFPLPFMLHPAHHRPQLKMGRPVQEGDVIQPVGNFSGVEYARKAMDTHWMTGQEMREAIPPAYTAWIGAQVQNHMAYWDAAVGLRWSTGRTT